MMDDRQTTNRTEQPKNNHHKNSKSSISAPTVSRFDIILGAIPCLMAFGALAGVTGFVTFELGILVSAVASVVLLADAMFLNPPVSAPTEAPEAVERQDSPAYTAD